VNEVAQSVRDPETSVSVQERLRAQIAVSGYDGSATAEQKEAAKQAVAGGDLPIEALGSGSDYTPFIQHLGLASLEVSYSGEEDQGGVYHSIYDSFDHYVRFGDPGFAYGITEAQTVGRVILRMANAEVLPMQFTGFADTVAGYLQEVHKLADGRREQSEQLAKLIDNKAFALAADPTRVVAAPEREPEVPYLDFAALDNVVARLQKSAKAYDDAYNARVARGTQLSAPQRDQLNELLRGLEQTLISPQGLPGRDWYKHLIYAPGLLTGYGVKTLPGVREAIESSRWDEANRFSVLTAGVLTKYCDRLDQATALAGGGKELTVSGPADKPANP
jgi:N-acetylated-alpha-linked acidic dipeptidase